MMANFYGIEQHSWVAHDVHVNNKSSLQGRLCQMWEHSSLKKYLQNYLLYMYKCLRVNMYVRIIPREMVQSMYMYIGTTYSSS